jgi:deazaflavin-dependent oxidoreductase (nitroreductase family)
MALYGKEHVDRYRATDGLEGHHWNDTQALLLTTKGRKSGEPKVSPLIYDLHRGDYVVVASKGGAPEHPAWFLNIQADPEVEVQVWGDKFKARARTATAEERQEIWDKMVAEWPDYENYAKKTDREIPLVILEREGAERK